MFNTKDKAFAKGDKFRVLASSIKARRTRDDTEGLILTSGMEFELLGNIPDSTSGKGEQIARIIDRGDPDSRWQKVYVTGAGLESLVNKQMIDQLVKGETY